MAEVVTFGEAMLRLSPPGHGRIEQARVFEIWPAGAELNVAVGLARMGTSTAWVSRLPRTPLARLVTAPALAAGVDLDHLLWSDEDRLGLYFVEAGRPPRPTTALYDRAGSAFAGLDPNELRWPEILVGARHFHVSGITPALSPACARATEDGLTAARAAGCGTSYDLNLRRRLTTPGAARAFLEGIAPQLDVLLCSDADARELFGEDSAAGLRARLGVPLVVVSGWETPELRRRTAAAETTETIRRPRLEDAEPIGAGDAFCAGFLRGLLTGDLRQALRVGDAVSALKLTIPGDAPLVDPLEVEALLDGSAAVLER